MANISLKNSEIQPLLHLIEQVTSFDLSAERKQLDNLKVVGNVTVTKTVPASTTEPAASIVLALTLTDD